MRPTAPPGPPGWMPPPQGYPAYPGQGYPPPQPAGCPPPGWMPPPPGPYHAAQLYPGQPFPGQGYPPQPCPYQPGPAMGPLSPHLSAFTQNYDADQTWEGSPADVSKELGLIDKRGNDIYPQGRDNCKQFLMECQSKGLRFRIKARKTKPYWTWFYEVNTSGGYSAPTLFGGLSPNLSDFTQYHNADQTWEGTPSDVGKELELIDKRGNDNYPQGRDNCRQFLRECLAKGLTFKIKAMKTKPYWTWFYEVNTSGGYSAPTLFGGLSPNLSDFTQYHDSDQTWEGTPSDVGKELDLIDKRNNDTYPQGRDNCRQFLRECLAKGLTFKIKAKKTHPYWTWYYEVNTSASPMSGGYSSYGGLSPNLSDFTQYHNADQTWECSSSDAAKELRLIDDRRNDSYPQGRDNCRQFLMECQSKGFRFKVKAKKTKPYWTWYYELNN